MKKNKSSTETQLNILQCIYGNFILYINCLFACKSFSNVFHVQLTCCALTKRLLHLNFNWKCTN